MLSTLYIIMKRHTSNFHISVDIILAVRFSLFHYVRWMHSLEIKTETTGVWAAFMRVH